MIRVMSFNIRYGLADDGDNHWNRRKHFALDRIRAFGPDLLGLQECRDDGQAEFVRACLPEYHFWGVHRQGPGDTALEMAPLLFRRSAFTLLDSGCFWLSESPDDPGSMSWGSNYPRTVSWVRLACRGTGKTLLYANTHFDYEPSAIDGDARCLRQWLDRHCREMPCIVTGDFNADKRSDAYRLLTDGGNLLDALRQVAPQGGNESTFHAFGRPEEQAAIDWILVSSHFRVTEARIDRSCHGHLFPSDHYPITAVLDWQR
ncbi:Endonuclease/exonuclease/phosphatase [Desulfobulbus propionicus DSM 2032]|jgi:endonuclease/exonuclease/phosphatase family metal-dependent hydrolase|uniref:Endonuclease/exonuclease/phosphatase n=2 Tax=Desulfobulbus propionicus TaxID=894 RepID=A0A7U3YNU7_DESPD|nr:Endonuclease/exonuclease/phosphatase [Desulfobulbus propionicus DSM 2032]